MAPTYTVRAEERKTYPRVGRCIYCGSADELTDEHIVPYGLGGNLILPAASCRACQTTIGRTERLCLRRMLDRARVHLDLPTRRNKEREQRKLEARPLHVVMPGGRTEVKNVPFMEHPPVLCLYHFPRPYKPLGIPAPENVDCVAWVHGYDPSTIRNPEQYGGIGVRVAEHSAYAFAQMLAKIAHAFAVAEMGLTAFRHLLPDFILGKRRGYNEHVGGNINETPPLAFRHGLNCRVVREVDGRDYVAVDIRLFADQGAPEYYVLVGETGSAVTLP